MRFDCGDCSASSSCAAPRRVLHPPTSRISVPTTIRPYAVDTMLLCMCLLSSGKESGVRFRIVIMCVSRWGFEASSGRCGRERQMCGRRGRE